MKRILLFYCTLLVIVGIPSQEHNPGGVVSPSLWLTTEQNPTQTYYSNPLGSYTDPTPNTTERYLLNGHPAKYFKDLQYEFPIQGLEKDQMSIFCVYQLEDTLSEKHVWSLSQPDKLMYTLSSFRFADLEGYQYREVRVHSQKYPELHTYRHYKDSLYTDAFTLQLGKKSTLEALPISHFQGIMPEFIVYPRALSSQDQQKVESYLAIKYGINLSETHPSSYLNSQGKTIWDPKENQHYHYRVFALGRDDASGLIQTQSSSSYAPTLLNFSYTQPETIQDQEFVFVSDNGKGLSLENTRNGKPMAIQRKWRITNTNLRPLNGILDLNEIENKNPEQYLYLEVDPIGDPTQETFPLEYYRIDSTQQQLAIEDYDVDADQNGTTILGIIQAPEMFVQCHLEFALCGENNQGKLQTKVEGGTAPYTLQLQTTSGETLESWTQSNTEQIHTIETLGLGDFILRVTDAQGHQYTQDFYMQSEDAPSPVLQDHYRLIEGSSLTIDASEHMPEDLQYQWYFQDQVQSTQSAIRITKAGPYEVRIRTSEGCESRKTITVSQESADNIHSIEVFPNPSKGDYLVRIILLRKAPTQISIYTSDGRLMHTETLGDERYFLYRGHLSQNGIYFIKVESENDSHTQKLIIQQ